jgi:hypothetical protein
MVIHLYSSFSYAYCYDRLMMIWSRRLYADSKRSSLIAYIAIHVVRDINTPDFALKKDCFVFPEMEQVKLHSWISSLFLLGKALHQWFLCV